jgi:hypothetical protein
MKLLNNSMRGLQSELIVLFRTIARFKSVPYEDILDWCAPKTIVKDQRRIRGALRIWIAIGLFNRDGDSVKLNDQLENIKKSNIDFYTSQLPKIALELLCSREQAYPIWSDDDDDDDDDSSSGNSGDFIRGASWMLAQDIYTFPTKATFSNVGALMVRQAQSKTILRQDFRYNSLRHWMLYFGLTTGTGEHLKIDPTTAIESQLDSIFGNNKELPAKNFLASLSSKLPILDFGEYRQEVEKNLKDDALRRLNPNEVSQSLSFALKRLDLKGAIKLRGLSDTSSSYRLLGQDYRHWSNFEAVARGKKI